MNQSLNEFIEALNPQCASAGISFTRWPKSRHPSLSIVELVAQARRTLAYIKVRNARRGFWGLNPNQLREMEDSTRPWCLILLHGTGRTGFFLPSRVVNNATGTSWHPGHDTEFKVNENAVVTLAKAQAQSYSVLHNQLIEFARAVG